MRFSRIPFLASLVAAAALQAAPGVRWEHDLAAAKARASKENKRIFMDLWTEWCPPCRHLQEKVFPAPAAQAALGRVVPLSVLVERRDRTPVKEGSELAQRYGLEAFPTLLILDAQGRELRRHVGAFRSAEDLAAWLAE